MNLKEESKIQEQKLRVLKQPEPMEENIKSQNNSKRVHKMNSGFSEDLEVANVNRNEQSSKNTESVEYGNIN